MYYTVASETERIIDSSSKCPDPQEQANLYGCSVYIIEGQHTGLKADAHMPNPTCPGCEANAGIGTDFVEAGIAFKQQSLVEH